MPDSSGVHAAPSVWCSSDALSDRVKALRDEYFSHESRRFHNEVLPFTTGTPWDTVFARASWTNVPEVTPFLKGFEDSLLAAARPVPLAADFWDRPLPVRVALFFSEVLRAQLPVTILEGELIVGAHFNVALSLCLNKREAKRRKRMADRFLADIMAASNLGIGNCGAVPGHLIPNYPKALRIGFRGIVDEIERALAACRNAERRAALESFRIAAKAVRDFSNRYAEEAERVAADASPDRASELKHIARICRRVPWEPPETFHEALQALWFTHMLVMAAESYPGPGLSPGRIDQYLYPYYRRDLEEGRLTRDQARELLQCYWIKHNYAYDYQGRVGTNQGINSSFGQLITLGGIGPDGQDASNDLTRLMLDVIGEMNLLEPKPNVRLHQNTPDDLLQRVTELIAQAQGSPFLLNFDEASIRGLEWEGLPKEQLWDYAPVGCLENTLQGCDRSGTVDVNLNIAKAVELALNHGKDVASGVQIGPRTGDPRTFRDFEAFFAAFKAQLKAILHHLIDAASEADAIRAAFEPTPFLSTLVDGCADSGRDITQGGARHNYITVEGIALATAVDSVAAVKRLVFDERKVSMEELLAALRSNFEGYEEIRQTLRNKAPKFGNDDPYADDLGREVSQFWTEEAFRHTSPATGRRYRGGYLSWNYWVAYAPTTAATPDGRRRGTFLSNGVCPVDGVDREGPTAVVKSVGQLGLETAPNGASHTISLSPSLVGDSEHREKLAALLRAYGLVGGTALQINVLDAATLRAAQADPDAYRNLLVRVTGYNAYFVMLGKEIQDEIIARSAHQCR